MTKEKQQQLLTLLDEYYNELSKTCDFNCDICDLGMLEGYGYGYSCPVEKVARKIGEDLYE